MGNILFDQDGAGMQEILESNWEKVGLARLDAFDSRAKTESLQYKIVLGAGFLLSGMEMIAEDFEGNLASAVNDKSIGPASNGKVGSLSKGEAEDLGYFAATMQIMDAIYDEDSSVRMLVSGYSQRRRKSATGSNVRGGKIWEKTSGYHHRQRRRSEVLFATFVRRWTHELFEIRRSDEVLRKRVRLRTLFRSVGCARI